MKKEKSKKEIITYDGISKLIEKSAEKTIDILTLLMGRGFNDVYKRFDKVDERLDKVETRLDKVETRLDKVEIRINEVEENLTFKINSINNRIDDLAFNRAKYDDVIKLDHRVSALEVKVFFKKR